MIRHEKRIITEGVDLGSINSPRRTLTKNILFNQFQEFLGYKDANLQNMEETIVRNVNDVPSDHDVAKDNISKKNVSTVFCITVSHRQW